MAQDRTQALLEMVGGQADSGTTALLDMVGEPDRPDSGRIDRETAGSGIGSTGFHPDPAGSEALSPTAFLREPSSGTTPLVPQAQTRPDVLGSAMRGAEAGTGSAVQWIGRFGTKALQALPNPLDERTRAAKGREVQAAQEPGIALQQHAQGAYPAPETYPQKLAEAAGGLAPYLGAEVATGGAASPAILGLLGGQHATGQYDAVLAKTHDENKAMQAGGVGAMTAPLVLAPLGRILGRLSKASPEIGSVLVEGLQGAATGALGPGSAAVIGEMAHEHLTGEERDALRAGLETAAISGPLFGLLGAAAGLKAGAGPRSGHEPEPITQAEQLAGGSAGTEAIQVANPSPADAAPIPEPAAKPLETPPEQAAAPPALKPEPGAEGLSKGAAVPEPAQVQAPPESARVQKEPPGPAPPPESSPTGLKNRLVDEERAKRGEPPMMGAARQEAPEVWDKAMKAIDEDPGLPDRLISELNDPASTRPISAVENDVLVRTKLDATAEQTRVAEDFLKAVQAGDEARATELRTRGAALSDKLLDIENAGKAGGREWGRAGVARQRVMAEDWSYPRMETLLRVAKSGKPLTPENEAWLHDLRERLTAAEKDLADIQAKGFAEPRPRVPRQPGKVLEFIGQRASEARARIKARGARAMAGLDPADLADRVIVGAEYLAKDVSAFADWSKAMLTEFGEKIQPHLQDIYDRASAFLASGPKEAGKMQAREKRAETTIAQLQAKLDAGDFSKPERKEPAPPSPRLRAAQAKLERIRQEFREGQVKEQLAARTPTEKALDTFAKWRRAFLLSSPTTLAKLTSAGFERIGFTPGEEAVGAGFSAAFPKLAEKAPREGGMSVRAEAKALTQGFTKGMADAAEILKTGKSDLDVLYGPKSPMPRDAADFLGAVHGALKAPTKRAEFARSFEKRTEWAIRQGLDVSDPVVQSRIALDSYKDANRAIFMQDNRLVSAWKRGLAALEQPNKDTGRPSPFGKAAATAGKVLFPIVKVPTNIVAETAQYALGSVYGSAKLAQAYARGIENLTPTEADSIMRSLKKGSVGAAGIALGYFAADQIGGYYQPGKRNDRDVKFGSVRLFGLDVPSMLIHNPLLETLQLGATIRRVADSKLRKKDPESQGVGAGVMAAALGLLEEVPFVREPVEMAKVMDPHMRDSAIGQTVESFVVPSGIAWIARQIDKEHGETVKRKPQGILQHIEEGIPGLRSTLPKRVGAR